MDTCVASLWIVRSIKLEGQRTESPLTQTSGHTSLWSRSTEQMRSRKHWGVHMLRTDCKPDWLINGPPVYKSVSPFVIWLACFW